MPRWLALSSAALLISCVAPPPSPPPRPATGPDIGVISKELQESWDRCLEQSYQITRTQTADKNAAAEMAFQACSSEEADLASLPFSNLLMPHLKAETKHVLIEGGRLP